MHVCHDTKEHNINGQSKTYHGKQAKQSKYTTTMYTKLNNTNKHSTTKIRPQQQQKHNNHIYITSRIRQWQHNGNTKKAHMIMTQRQRTIIQSGNIEEHNKEETTHSEHPGTKKQRPRHQTTQNHLTQRQRTCIQITKQHHEHTDDNDKATITQITQLHI